MDAIMQKVMGQAMNFAIRSGISITSGYAIAQCSRLLQNTNSGQERRELERLQGRLESKVRIISPAIDLIELISARGNTALESAISLTKALRWDIQSLGVKISNAAVEEEKLNRGASKAPSRQQQDAELREIIADIKALLDKIDDAVPLVNLAITTSGVTLSTSLPASISPSRLLQASTFLTAGDSRFAMESAKYMQIGPSFTLSLYMLFAGHAHRPLDEEGLRSTTWKEVIHKARVKLMRVPISDLYSMPFSDGDAADDHAEDSSGYAYMSAEQRANEFAYQLVIVEDLQDDRFHSMEEMESQPMPLGDVDMAGISEVLPIHQVSKIFYADTGKILNISSDSETNNPVLLLKRDPNAHAPRRMMDQPSAATWNDDDERAGEHADAVPSTEVDNSKEGQHSNAQGLPSGLDPEWMAFEVYSEEYDEDDEDDEVAPAAFKDGYPTHDASRAASTDPEVTKALSNLRVSSPIGSPSTPHASRTTLEQDLIASPSHDAARTQQKQSKMFLPSIRTSLSLLEMLIRLTSLQQFQQSSHLAITDELLNFFLEESSTTGAAPGNTEERKRIRMQARSHIGFDPYDESPIKRRGEMYQEHDADYEPSWADAANGQYSPEPSSEDVHLRSPMLLRSREHSSQSRAMTPELSPRQSSKSEAPRTRSRALRSAASTDRQTRSSPLAAHPSSSDDNNDDRHDTPAST